MADTLLFSPLTIRGIELKNRIVVPPMHQYSAIKGFLCYFCSKELPLKYAELDRLNASAGYTVENTRLVHHDCHIKDQAEKSYL